MSYTKLNGQPQGLASAFTNKLREILIAEVVAINGYQNHIAHSDIEEINTAWHNIMVDEKKHYGWILQLLRKYDAEQSQQFLAHKSDNPGPQSPLSGSNQSPDIQTILNNLRDDIKGEMEAVILYEAEIAGLPHPDIKSVLRSIIVEEKGHAEHLTRLLLKYDPDPYASLN